MWTLRKKLIVEARHLRRRENISPHMAIEEIIAAWKQKQINHAAVDYYINLSSLGLIRLVNEVGRNV